MPRPSDFYVTMIDFFGVLLPGAFLTYLRGDQLREIVGLSSPATPAVAWSAFLVVSYVAGQLMLGVGVLLNDTFLMLYERRKQDDLYQVVRRYIAAEQPIPQTKRETFYRVAAFLRLSAPQAIFEVDRQMAEYKLFRSLMIVFAIDALFSILHPARLGVSAAVCAIAAWRFAFLLHWTYRTAFEYYITVRSAVTPALPSHAA